MLINQQSADEASAGEALGWTLWEIKDSQRKLSPRTQGIYSLAAEIGQVNETVRKQQSKKVLS